MKKKRFIRISKRIFVLLLCCSLVSGACFNKYKVTANAAAMTATLGSYAAYEIVLYVGGLLAACCGAGALIDNRDKIAELGKNFIDSMDLDEVSGWMLSKVNTTGQSYIYGTEALKEVQEMEFTVIQGGGNMPENNNDNDDDGDIDADDRTEELKKLGLWATASFTEMLCDYIEPLIQEAQAGQDNIITEIFPLNDVYFHEYQMNDLGQYSVNIYYQRLYNDNTLYASASGFTDYMPVYCLIGNSYQLLVYKGTRLYIHSALNGTVEVISPSGEVVNTNNNYSLSSIPVDGLDYYSCNIPFFSSEAAALSFCQNGDLSGCINGSKVYQIADWLQEDWSSPLTQLNTGIRSLNDNMLIVGEAMNQALQNQLNGLGYISAIGEGIAGALPLALPDSIADPIYYPATSLVPELAPEELPWNVPVVSPDPGQTPGMDPTPEPGEDVVIGDYAIDLRKLFPFCIPFDFVALLRVLNAEPEAPRFEIPFVVPSVGIDETYIIDLSMFDDAMEIIRVFELVGFVIGLMFLTGKVIKW